jgi:hypothetical protein
MQWPDAHPQLVQGGVVPLPRVLQPLHAQLQPAGAPLDTPPRLLPRRRAGLPPPLPPYTCSKEAYDYDYDFTKYPFSDEHRALQ